MILGGALELGKPFSIVLNRDEGFGPLYLGRGCDLEGRSSILRVIPREGLPVSDQCSWQQRK